MTVAVIGAGVIGLAIADALVRRGARVTVLEMRGPGRGAAQASAGILAPYVEADPESPLLPLAARSLELFDGFITRAAETSGRPIEYSRTGTLQVAFTDRQAEEFAEAHSWLGSRGVASALLTPHELHTSSPAVAADAIAGLVIPTHGFVHVPSLVTALAQSARFGGATIEAPVEVVSIEPTRTGAEVRTGEHRYDVDVVVLAAGSWTGKVRVKMPGGLRPLPVRPVRGQLLHLTWSPSSPRPATVVWGPACYTVPWSDGSVLVGATMEEAGFDERPTVEGVRTLSDAVAALLPAARHAAIAGVRVGLRPALPDALPAIGAFRAAPQIVAATGHFRNGILLAPLTADLVSRLVLDRVEDPALAQTVPDRFDVR